MELYDSAFSVNQGYIFIFTDLFSDISWFLQFNAV